MKRAVAIALVTMLMLILALVVYGDDERTTEVSYVVESTKYEITIPASISLNSTSQFPITLSECHSSMNIYLSSPYADAGILRMKGISHGKYLNYTISDSEGRSYGPYNPIIVSGEGVTLVFTPDNGNLKLMPNDTYKDILTFTIE